MLNTTGSWLQGVHSDLGVDSGCCCKELVLGSPVFNAATPNAFSVLIL
jgi:hypothetical protein